MSYKGFMGVLCLWSLFLCLACTDTHNGEADRLNDISYAFHYKNLDSTYHYARKAYHASKNYSSGKAEALNNMAFVSIANMDYSLASRQLDSVFVITDNQIELLIADVQYMRLCQRKARNKDFYDYKEHAATRMKRISEERATLSPREQSRLLYAETEFAIVASTYYYYVGLYDQAYAALSQIDAGDLMQKDTAQYLNMLYQRGSGGMIRARSHADILQREYETLLECFLLARKKGYPYWEANSMQAISERLATPSDRKLILERNGISAGFLNSDNMPDSLLAGNLAQRSSQMFGEYGDIYQTAGSQRTLARCFHEIGDDESSLICLKRSLSDSAILQTPDLVASIYEQMSIVYSSMNDKYHSDVYRNRYLDLQELTRQDMELDARAAKLSHTSDVMNAMIFVIILLILCLLALIVKLLRSRSAEMNISGFLNKLKVQSEEVNGLALTKLSDYNEELNEKLGISRLNLENNKRRNVENRAKAFLVNSVLPLVDRMANEVDKLRDRDEDAAVRGERTAYLSELSRTIDEYNRALTDWIKLKQGEVNLKVATFSLQDLFDIVKKSTTVFALQGIRLIVEDSDAKVKADRVLTLFMINTIADNARKFTPRGGTVRIYAETLQDSVEISVSDTGRGMTDKELAGVFDRKISEGHGFGLINCKGILDKYRKYSKIFDVCVLSAESEKGKGSRFFFRLPRGVVAVLLLAVSAVSAAHADINAVRHDNSAHDGCMRMAAAYADSAYYSNVAATYSRTLDYADSARIWLNRHYAGISGGGNDCMRMAGDDTADAPELKWFKSGLKTDYKVILDIRNESAIAALALHEWQAYSYNNSIYTKLFKEVYSDKTLGEYCRIMQRSETNKNIAVILLVLLLIALFLSVYILFYRRAMKISSARSLKAQLCGMVTAADSIEAKLRMLSAIRVGMRADSDEGRQLAEIAGLYKEAAERERRLAEERRSLEDGIRQVNFENDRLYVCNNILENCLSTIKHETMYYPSRIHNCLSAAFPVTGDGGCADGGSQAIGELSDIVGYYRELYRILCAQLNMQVESYRYPCVPVDISGLVHHEGITVWGDRDLLAYIFLTIRKLNGGELPLYDVTADGAYLKIHTIVSADMYRLSGAANAFVPDKSNVPFLVIRQILRETSSATNLCACGVSVRFTGAGAELTVVLPEYNKTSKKI